MNLKRLFLIFTLLMIGTIAFQSLKPSETALHRAIRTKDIETIKKLISKQDINRPDEHGSTLLHMAASMGSKEFAEILINNKAMVNIQTPGGMTPLHLAVQGQGKNYQETVEYLLSRGADPELKNKYGIKPLDKALYNPDYKILEILERYGQKIEGVTLHLAIKADRAVTPEKIKQAQEKIDYLIKHGATLEDRDEKGKTALSHAASARDTAALTVLLKMGANPNDSSRPLNLAAERNHLAAIELLIKNKADINQRDGNGLTPFLTAVKWNREAIVSYFLEGVTDVNDPKSHDFKALNIAAKRWNSNVLKILLLHIKDKPRLNEALIEAAKSRNEKNAEILLEAGANINAQDENGMTALHYAAQWKPIIVDSSGLGNDTEPSLLIVLLPHKPDQSIKNNQNKTALELAQENGEEQVIKLLENPD